MQFPGMFVSPRFEPTSFIIGISTFRCPMTGPFIIPSGSSGAGEVSGGGEITPLAGAGRQNRGNGILGLHKKRLSVLIFNVQLKPCRHALLLRGGFALLDQTKKMVYTLYMLALICGGVI